jgi:hypothetical protein
MKSTRRKDMEFSPKVKGSVLLRLAIKNFFVRLVMNEQQRHLCELAALLP